MRNIRILRKVSKKINPKLVNENSVFYTGTGIDSEKCLLFGILSDGETTSRLISYEIKDNEIEEKIICEDAVLDNVFQVQYVHSTQSLFLATRNGSFIQFSVNQEFEELFQSETGIIKFSVSPDSRLLALITNDQKLLLLRYPNLDIVANISLNEESEKKSEVLNISWRNDTCYFAINMYDTKLGARKIKVYDENGILFSTNDDTCSLNEESILEWNPAGSLISTLGFQDSKILNVFHFELNGLLRGNFDPYKFQDTQSSKEPILELQWNNSGEILAICKNNSIELWTRSNYFWMLKRTIVSDEAENTKIKFMSWDKDWSNRVHILFDDLTYYIYDFNIEYSTGYSGGSNLCSSICGNNLFSIPFRYSCAPPPQGYFKTTLNGQIKEVIIGEFCDGLVCLMNDSKLKFFKNLKTSLEEGKEIIIPKDIIMGSYDWKWMKENQFCFIDKNSNLALLNLHTESYEQEPSVQILKETSNCKSLYPIYGKEDEIIILFNDGSIFLFNIMNQSKDFIAKLSDETNYSLNYLIIDNSSCSTSSNIIFFAHDLITRKLCCNFNGTEKRLSTECTSFTVFENNLLFTTFQGTLEIIEAVKIKDFMENTNQTINSDHIYSRKIEKGSKIVICCIQRNIQPVLVLQILPRGNFETILPRPLLLSSLKLQLRAKIDNIDYNSIMESMRKNRIDFNILVNELKLIEIENKDDSTFNFNNIFEALIKGVKNKNILVNLVTELSSDNLPFVSRISSILNKLMIAGEVEQLEFPYLASKAKLGEFEDALKSKIISDENLKREIVKKRVEFLSFYCDNNEVLFENALGTYDLSLTSIVADCLNKDPKEYLPALNEFKEMSAEKRNYTIDNRLKRYAKAAQSLIKDNEVKLIEIIKYVDKHKVYQPTIEYLKTMDKKEGDRTNDILLRLYSVYGKYLQEHGKYKEATIFYSRGESIEEAINSAIKIKAWEIALGFAFEKQYNKEKINDICKKLIIALTESEDFSSCAQIYEDYLQDFKSALDFWIKAKMWKKAKLVCLKNPELGSNIESMIKPKLKESTQLLEETFKSNSKEIEQYTRRFKIIRETKEKAFENGELWEHDNFSDTESVSSYRSSSSSASSANTGKTYRSQKNKRKLEKRIYSLKEGSKYEDTGITAHLWDIFNRIQTDVKREMANNVESLWHFGLDEEAVSLSISFDSLLNLTDASIKILWAPTSLPANPNIDGKYKQPPIGWSATWDKFSLYTLQQNKMDNNSQFT